MADAPEVKSEVTPEVSSPAAPAAEVNEDTTDWAAEAAKWKAMSRKHEDNAKSFADKAKRFDAFEESQKTETQRLADAKAAVEAEAATAKAELALLQAAVKHNLSADDLELLGNHGTPEEIDARAAKLAARLKTAADNKVKPDFGGGARGEDVAGAKQLSADDVKKLYASKDYDAIEKAREEGRLSTLLGA